VQAARLATQQREAQERNRLLYVALTRARDRLYIAGFEGVRGRTEGCWYDLIRDALSASLTETRDGDGHRVWRMEARQEAPHEPQRGKADEAYASVERAAWAERAAPQEPVVLLPLAPSRLAPLETDDEGEPLERSPSPRSAEEPPCPSPSQGSGQHRFLRGTLTHALLQHLPTMSPKDWEAAAHRFIELRGAPLAPRTRASIVAETLAVLRKPEFAPLFGPESVAEVPIVAEIEVPGRTRRTLRLAGQIDRLVRVGQDVLIVDYKTNRPAPRDPARIPEAYRLQLAAYRIALGHIYGGARVRAALLWTDGPHIMEVSVAELDNAEKRLFTLDRAMLDA
jgi:ATP-dependent helicase/nuclease subunit A